MAKRVACVDWDGTLVDVQSQEWLPGAEDALRRLLTLFNTVIVHTCRANWPEGRAQVETKLQTVVSKPWESTLGERLRVEAKPSADVYIDNLAVPFLGDWDAALHAAQHVVAQREAAEIAASPAKVARYARTLAGADVKYTAPPARPTFKPVR